MIQIAYYDGNNITKRNAVEAVLQSLAYSYKILNEKDLQQRIGALMDLEGYEQKTNTNSSEHPLELMILNALQDEEIQQLSNLLKEAQAHVPCKAVVTNHNKEWILYDLLEEIAEEHAYFELYDTLKQAILELSSLSESAYTKQSWMPYQQACMEAYILLQNKQPQIVDIETHLKTIQTYYTQLQKA